MPSKKRRIVGDIYGAEVLKDLRDLSTRTSHVWLPEDLEAYDRIVAFLEGRLSEAAIHGCHHCDEEANGRGAPCHWCGLVYSRRRI